MSTPSSSAYSLNQFTSCILAEIVLLYLCQFIKNSEINSCKTNNVSTVGLRVKPFVTLLSKTLYKRFSVEKRHHTKQVYIYIILTIHANHFLWLSNPSCQHYMLPWARVVENKMTLVCLLYRVTTVPI